MSDKIIWNATISNMRRNASEPPATYEELYQAFKERWNREIKFFGLDLDSSKSISHEELIRKSDVLFKVKDGDVINGVKWAGSKSEEAHMNASASEHMQGNLDMIKKGVERLESWTPHVLVKEELGPIMSNEELADGVGQSLVDSIIKEQSEHNARVSSMQHIAKAVSDYTTVPVEYLGNKNVDIGYDGWEWFKVEGKRPYGTSSKDSFEIMFGLLKYVEGEEGCLYEDHPMDKEEYPATPDEATEEAKEESLGATVSDKHHISGSIWKIYTDAELKQRKKYRSYGDTTGFSDHFEVIGELIVPADKHCYLVKEVRND